GFAIFRMIITLTVSGPGSIFFQFFLRVGPIRQEVPPGGCGADNRVCPAPDRQESLLEQLSRTGDDHDTGMALGAGGGGRPGATRGVSDVPPGDGPDAAVGLLLTASAAVLSADAAVSAAARDGGPGGSGASANPGHAARRRDLPVIGAEA